MNINQLYNSLMANASDAASFCIVKTVNEHRVECSMPSGKEVAFAKRGRTAYSPPEQAKRPIWVVRFYRPDGRPDFDTGFTPSNHHRKRISADDAPSILNRYAES